MKVQFGAGEKKYVTVAEVPEVKAIISMCKEYDIKEYALIAAHAIHNADFEILKAEASIVKNRDAWNYYTDDSGTLDVWIHIYAYNDYYGFYVIGAHLSEIETLPADELINHMYIREYKGIDR